MARARQTRGVQPASDDALWQKSATPNLYRYLPSGRYFARAKVGGKLIRQSLKTSTYSVAVLRLADLLKERRGLAEANEHAAGGSMSFGQAAELMLKQIDGNPAIKSSTRAYRRRCLAALVKTWPGLQETDLRRITATQCLEWASRYAKAYSPTMYNNTVGTLRMVLDVGIKGGVRFSNPASEVRKVKVPLRSLRLPTPKQFQEMLQIIAEGGGRFSRDCADLVAFLGYGGFRKGEAAAVQWSDCDLKKRRILVQGNAIHGTKNSESRWIPMNEPMAQLLERLRSERPEETTTQLVIKVQECQKSLTKACKLLEIDRITHHDLRHFFATCCIEEGIDIPTVSRWLGHKDGGALAMRIYGHLSDHHSQAMAQRLTFGTKQAEADTARER